MTQSQQEWMVAYAAPDRLPDGRRKRRHHNNDGRRQIRRGKTREQVRRIAERLGIPYKEDE